MSFNFILLFSMTVFVTSIIPGPSMLLALTHGIQFGAKRTIASAMGNVTVTVIQASVSVAGLGTILIASETTFQLVKWAGAAYLIYMGISMLCSSKMSLSSSEATHTNQGGALRRMYFQAAFVTAGNPKAIVFLLQSFLNLLIPMQPICLSSAYLLAFALSLHLYAL